jgi:hypothetical protein
MGLIPLFTSKTRNFNDTDCHKHKVEKYFMTCKNYCVLITSCKSKAVPLQAMEASGGGEEV